MLSYIVVYAHQLSRGTNFRKIYSQWDYFCNQIWSCSDHLKLIWKCFDEGFLKNDFLKVLDEIVVIKCISNSEIHRWRFKPKWLINDEIHVI